MSGSFKPKGVLNEEDGLSYSRHRECINGKKKKRIEDDGRIEKYLRKMKNINRSREEKKSSLSRINYKKSKSLYGGLFIY
jgi:hypothetical protein